jgi:IS605 OrfB family transposase
MATKLRTKDDVHGQVIHTVTCTVKVKVPKALAAGLEALHEKAAGAVKEMLAHRDRSSTKHYPTIPSVIAKSLVAKYQRNAKCRHVAHLVLPLVGDKGKQIKLEAGGIRIPALFKKAVLPVVWLRPVVGFVRSAEFFRRGSDWFASICYNTAAEPAFRPTGMVGVDRNSVGHVATLADLENGKVLHLGYSPAATKTVWRGRRGNLQASGRRRLLFRIKRKQSRRTTHENHKVSKQIVDYAARHRRAVVVEQLEGIRRGKCRRYVERSQWAFFQLLTFLRYKAALRSVMVIEVDPAYSSQECSRCHQRSKPDGKKFLCGFCGHNDHRDANAAFVLAQRAEPIGGVARKSERPRRGLLVVPSPGSMERAEGSARLMACP